MSQPIGTRITSICELLELCGPLSYPEICEVMPDLERANVYKYCQRAVGLRLLSVDRTESPAKYSLLPGWREKLSAKKHMPRVASLKAPTWSGPRISSVWGLGAGV